MLRLSLLLPFLLYPAVHYTTVCAPLARGGLVKVAGSCSRAKHSQTVHKQHKRQQQVLVSICILLSGLAYLHNPLCPCVCLLAVPVEDSCSGAKLCTCGKKTYIFTRSSYCKHTVLFMAWPTLIDSASVCLGLGCCPGHKKTFVPSTRAAQGC